MVKIIPYAILFPFPYPSLRLNHIQKRSPFIRFPDKYCTHPNAKGKKDGVGNIVWIILLHKREYSIFTHLQTMKITEISQNNLSRKIPYLRDEASTP